MKKLIPGKYETRFASSSETPVSGEILKRTDKTAWVKIDGKVKRCKIYNSGEEEFIYPLGKYSLAPIFRPSRRIV